MAINDALPLKAARRDAIAKLKSFWGFESELQTNPMLFRLQSLWGATLMPLRVCVMDWGWHRILWVGKSSGLILSRLWTKFAKFWASVVSSALVLLSMSCFIQKIFTTKSRSRRKAEQAHFFGPQFFATDTPTIYGRCLAQFTVQCLAKFG